MSVVLVTGSRDWTDEVIIRKHLENLNSNDLVIHGGARGVDSIAQKICDSLGIPTKIFSPLKPDNPSYYLHRNAEMVAVCDVVLAFWDGESRGTKFTIDYARGRKRNIQSVMKITDWKNYGGKDGKE